MLTPDAGIKLSRELSSRAGLPGRTLTTATDEVFQDNSGNFAALADPRAIADEKACTESRGQANLRRHEHTEV